MRRFNVPHTRKKPKRMQNEPEPTKVPKNQKNANAVSNKIYYNCLVSDEEIDLFEHMNVDNLEEEIKMLRIQLRRATKLKNEQETFLQDKNTEKKAARLKHIKKTDGGMFDGQIETMREVQDLDGVIDRKFSTLLNYLKLYHQIKIGTMTEIDEECRIEARKKVEAEFGRLFVVVPESEMKQARERIAAMKSERGEN